jgi:uncharacterized protein (TIGR03546 family)
MITLIAKILAALNANSRPGEAAAGFACGILLALVPADNLLWILLFTVFFFLRLHLATMILTTVVFKLFIGAADPIIDALGLWILQLPRLEPLFIRAINTPVLPFLKFNNTLVMGGCAAGILLWVPSFLVGRMLVLLYRRRIRDRLASSKLVKFFEKTPLLRKLTTAVRKAGAVYQGWSG